METTIDGLSKPDVLLLLALACPPVLPGDASRLGVDTRLAGLHIAENFYGIQSTALVGVNPVVACHENKTVRRVSPSQIKKAISLLL